MHEFFNKVFFELPRLGPGSEEITLKTWHKIAELTPDPCRILDVGCGSGQSTVALLADPRIQLTATDINTPLLVKLASAASRDSLQQRLALVTADLAKLPFDKPAFDVVWSEGSIFLAGFETGLKLWKPLLKPSGIMVVSESAWFTDDPSPEIKGFWNSIYPDINDVAGYTKIAEEAGFEMLDSFNLPSYCWDERFYMPLEARLEELAAEIAHSKEAGIVAGELRHEIDMYRKYGDQYGYTMFIMRNRA